MYLCSLFLFVTSVLPSPADSPVKHHWSPHYAQVTRRPMVRKMIFLLLNSALSEMSLISTNVLLIIQSSQQRALSQAPQTFHLLP